MNKLKKTIIEQYVEETIDGGNSGTLIYDIIIDAGNSQGILIILNNETIYGSDSIGDYSDIINGGDSSNDFDNIIEILRDKIKWFNREKEVALNSAWFEYEIELQKLNKEKLYTKYFYKGEKTC